MDAHSDDDEGVVRPGRMHVERLQLKGGESGLDFVVPGRSVPEIFSARLMDGPDTLEILRIANLGIGTLSNRIAKVRQRAGGPHAFSRIVGYASDNIRELIVAGRFDRREFAAALGDRLGGRWSIDVIPKPNTCPPTWDIIATRHGD